MMAKRYLLLNDRPRKSIAIARLFSTSTYRALKGDIFVELPQDRQPTDNTKIAAALVDDKTIVIDIDTGDLSELSREEADLLLPVATGKERFDLFSTDLLRNAVHAAVNDTVLFCENHRELKGTIKYIGPLEGQKGTYFGVHLKQAHGNSDGTFKQKQYFPAKHNCATFVSLEKLKFLKFDKGNSNREAQAGFSKSNSKVCKGQAIGQVERLDSFRNLKLGMRVIAFDHNERKERVLRGKVEFIGRPRSRTKLYVGVALDTPDGSGDGIFETERVFKCDKNHALFTDAASIMEEARYDRDLHDTFVVLPDNQQNHEKEKQPKIQNGTTALESQGIGPGQLYLKEAFIEKRKHQQKQDLSFEMSKLSSQNSKNCTQRKTACSVSPSSLPFCEDHYQEKIKDPQDQKRSHSIPSYLDEGTNNSTRDKTGLQSGSKGLNGPPHIEDALRKDRIAELEYQNAGNDIQKSSAQKSYDKSLQVDSMVEVSLKGVAHYGLIKWIGVPDGVTKDELVAGLELEEPYQFGTDGIFGGKRYFSCPANRGFFIKLSNCKKDARFTGFSLPVATLPANQEVEEIEGSWLPPELIENALIGPMRGIQGHHNSCYMDSTLFAMFAFSIVFDIMLYRERRPDDIKQYEQVRKVLKDSIVNPLRSGGFVNASSVLQLRKWLDKLGSVQGFMNEEKDPEEFLMLLFRDVLKVDPFIKLRTDTDAIEKTFFYQIWIEKDENNPLPSLQYLIEQSFLTGNIRLEEVPSVFIVQLPRFGMQKIYKRIRLNEKLDISKVMSSAIFSCLICGSEASVSCRECCHWFGWAHPFVYFCDKCRPVVHSHSARTHHQVKALKNASFQHQQDQAIKTLELFAVVCIKTSHYVTFAKCGNEPNERWVFFDSMADRRGGENGHNIPEVVECPEVTQWFGEKPLKFTESDSKNTPEKILRLFEDASLCLYRSKELSMYK